MSEHKKGRYLQDLAAGFRWHVQRALLLVGLARIVLTGVLLVLLFCGVDWLFHIPWGWRVLPLLVLAGAVGSLAWFSIISPRRQRWTDKQLLEWLDSHDNHASLLLDRLELEELTEAKGIDPAWRRQAIEALPDLRSSQELFGRGFGSARYLRWLVGAVASILVLLGLCFAFPGFARIGAVRLFNPFSNTRWPHRTSITVDASDGGWHVAQGDGLTAGASVSGIEIPAEVSLFYRTRPKGSWVRERLRVSDEHRASFRFPEVREPLELYFVGGDDESETFSVQVARRPYIERILVRVQSPPYSGIPTRTKEGGDVEGLEGSNVHVEFTSSIPVKSVLLTFEGQPEQSATPAGERTFATDFMLSKNTSYGVRLVGISNAAEGRTEHFDVRVTPDAPPEASILLPEKDIEGTRKASCKIRWEASDDYELSKVELLYQVGDRPPQAFTDRITGPITVKTKRSTGEFSLDLSQLDLPEQDAVNLELFVRASDSNPTGRGVIDSTHRRIRVLKPSLFRESLLVEAKALVNEGLLAESNQRQAYEKGVDFLGGKGTGEENDPVWRELLDHQSGSSDAAQALSGRLAQLIDLASANRIQTEFMTGRLAQISTLLESVISRLHTHISQQLNEVKPRDAATAAPAATLARRRAALSKVVQTDDGQKRAVLELQRILFLIFDWSDLQSASVSGVWLYERQADCTHQTSAIAPEFVGKDVHELSDKDLERFIVLGKSQRVIRDEETALEEHLKQILTKAERQKRQSIRGPILAAFSRLRNDRVNDRLFKAASAIEKNQPADIQEDQNVALEAFRIVEAGFEAAGIPEKLAPLSLNQPIVNIDGEDEKKTVASQEQSETEAPVLLQPDRIGTDPLTTALLSGNDGLLNVVRRSAYLDGTVNPADLPRFARLRFKRLSELQHSAQVHIADALAEAEKTSQSFVAGMLKDVRVETDGALVLIDGKDISAGSRQILTDCAATLKDQVDFLATQRTIKQMRAEHDNQGGVDPFHRPYVLQGPNLAAAVDLSGSLLEVRCELQWSTRLLERWAQYKSVSGQRAMFETQERQRVRGRQAGLAQKVEACAKAPEKISIEVRPSVTESLGDVLKPALTDSMAATDGKDADVAHDAAEQHDRLAQALKKIRELIEKYSELPPPAQTDTAPPPADVTKMTEADYAKLMSLPALKECLKNAKGLPADLREVLSDSLSHDFSPEQQRFLSAYVRAVLSAQEEIKSEP